MKLGVVLLLLSSYGFSGEPPKYKISQACHLALDQPNTNKDKDTFFDDRGRSVLKLYAWDLVPPEEPSITIEKENERLKSFQEKYILQKTLDGEVEEFDVRSKLVLKNDDDRGCVPLSLEKYVGSQLSVRISLEGCKILPAFLEIIKKYEKMPNTNDDLSKRLAAVSETMKTDGNNIKRDPNAKYVYDKFVRSADGLKSKNMAQFSSVSSAIDFVFSDFKTDLKKNCDNFGFTKALERNQVPTRRSDEKKPSVSH